MTMCIRVGLVAGILGISCGSAVQAQSPSSASPQSYPAKPIRLIVGYTPGGGTDVLSRVLAKYLGENLKQTVIVDNRPGAGGLLATQLVANAPPDGYTLLTTPSTHAINPGLYAKLPYDSIKDFTSVGLIATSPNVVVVHASLPVRSVRELIALAKARPGELAFGSAGVGSTTHLAGEYFRSMAQIRTVHVPYKGSSQAEIDLSIGEVQYMIDSTPAALPNIRAGRHASACHHRHPPLFGSAGRPDRDGVGPATLRIGVVVGHHRTRRHDAGCRQPAERRDREDHAHARSEEADAGAGRRGEHQHAR